MTQKLGQISKTGHDKL